MRLIDADALNGYKFGLISPYAQNLFHKTINEAPMIVQEQSKWIPVSEKLPEEHKEVLTCSLGGFIEIQSVEHDYWENQHGDWSDIDEVDVVAWMPLPEPYKASPTGAESEVQDEDRG